MHGPAVEQHIEVYLNDGWIWTSGFEFKGRGIIGGNNFTFDMCIFIYGSRLIIAVKKRGILETGRKKHRH